MKEKDEIKLKIKKIFNSDKSLPKKEKKILKIIKKNDLDGILDLFLCDDKLANLFYSKKFLKKIIDLILLKTKKDFQSLREAILCVDKEGKMKLERDFFEKKEYSDFLMRVWDKNPKIFDVDQNKCLVNIAIERNLTDFILMLVRKKKSFLLNWIKKSDADKHQKILNLLNNNQSDRLCVHFMIISQHYIEEGWDLSKKDNMKNIQYISKSLSEYPKLTLMQKDIDSWFGIRAGSTLLKIAGESRNARQFKVILEKTPDDALNVQDVLGNTALHGLLRDFYPKERGRTFAATPLNRKEVEKMIGLAVNRGGFNGSVPNSEKETPIQILLEIKNPEWVALAFKNWSFTRKKDGSVFSKEELYGGLKAENEKNLRLNGVQVTQKELKTRDLCLLVLLSKPKNISIREFITDEIFNNVDNSNMRSFLVFLKYNKRSASPFSFFKGLSESAKRCGVVGVFHYIKHAVRCFFSELSTITDNDLKIVEQPEKELQESLQVEEKKAKTEKQTDTKKEDTKIDEVSIEVNDKNEKNKNISPNTNIEDAALNQQQEERLLAC